VKIDELSFEEALSKLEEVVKDLEKEDISLEDSMIKFEAGIQLSSHALRKLIVFITIYSYRLLLKK